MDAKSFQNLLLVDTDLLIRWSFEKALDKTWINFFSASSGEEALMILDVERIDCMITDFNLPDYDGLELLHLSNQIQPDLNMVLMTSFGSAQIRNEAEAIGSILLQKPFDIHYAVNILLNRLSIQRNSLMFNSEV